VEAPDLVTVKEFFAFEQQFNQWFHCPMVFLNDQPWDRSFVNALTEVASGEVQFKMIPKEMCPARDEEAGWPRHHVRRDGKLSPHVSVLFWVGFHKARLWKKCFSLTAGQANFTIMRHPSLMNCTGY
jgi:hypothetical protein